MANIGELKLILSPLLFHLTQYCFNIATIVFSANTFPISNCIFSVHLRMLVVLEANFTAVHLANLFIHYRIRFLVWILLSINSERGIIVFHILDSWHLNLELVTTILIDIKNDDRFTCRHIRVMTLLFLFNKLLVFCLDYSRINFKLFCFKIVVARVDLKHLLFILSKRLWDVFFVSILQSLWWRKRLLSKFPLERIAVFYDASFIHIFKIRRLNILNIDSLSTFIEELLNSLLISFIACFIFIFFVLLCSLLQSWEYVFLSFVCNYL